MRTPTNINNKSASVDGAGLFNKGKLRYSPAISGSTLTWDKIPAVFCADSNFTTRAIYEANGTPKEMDGSALPYNYENKDILFSDEGQADLSKKKITMYKEAQTGDNLTKVLKWIGAE